MEANVIEGAVVKAVLVRLHLALDTTDPSILTFLAPVAVLPPGHAGSLQHRVAAAAELDVVDRGVVAEQTLMGLHTNLERGEVAGGAVHGVGPLTKAAKMEMRVRQSGGKTSAEHGFTQTLQVLAVPGLHDSAERAFFPLYPPRECGQPGLCSSHLISAFLFHFGMNNKSTGESTASKWHQEASTVLNSLASVRFNVVQEASVSVLGTNEADAVQGGIIQAKLVRLHLRTQTRLQNLLQPARSSQVNLQMMAQMVPSNGCGFKLFELEHRAAE